MKKGCKNFNSALRSVPTLNENLEKIHNTSSKQVCTYCLKSVYYLSSIVRNTGFAQIQNTFQIVIEISVRANLPSYTCTFLYLQLFMKL